MKAVRDAVGHDIEIAIDINCELDPIAGAYARADVRALWPRICRGAGAGQRSGRMADFRRQTGMQVAAGRAWAGSTVSANFWCRRRSISCSRTSSIAAAIPAALRAADLALGFETPICNGGGSTQHNLHLQAGVVNGTVCEWHPYQSAGAVAAICPKAPMPKNGCAC